MSILKLRVHRQFIACVTVADGTHPDPEPSDPAWASPTLQRSRWFDLFDVKDRLEAYRAVWGIMSYMARPTKQAEDVAMTGV